MAPLKIVFNEVDSNDVLTRDLLQPPTTYYKENYKFHRKINEASSTH